MTDADVTAATPAAAATPSTATAAPQPAAPALPRGVTQPIPRELFRLALPVLVAQLTRVAYQWVDALWVRGLGIEATAAVTTSMFVLWTAYSLMDVFGVGMAAYVSQLLGAGNRERAGYAAYKGLRATAVLGITFGVAGCFGARGIYALMQAPQRVADTGAGYLSIILGAAPLAMMGFTFETVMRSAGNTRVPMTIDLCTVAFNAALDPFLIYGWGPFPRMGVAGAAVATALAQAISVISYATLAWRRHPALPLRRTPCGPPIRTAGLARVGLPTALIGIMFSLVYIAFSRSAARFGAPSLAIVGVANRIEAIQFVVSGAIGTAAAALVGQNLGARRPDRASLVMRTGVSWIAVVSIALTAIIATHPTLFLGLFTQDAEALRIGVPYLRILAICLLATGIEMVVAEAVQGSGHTRPMSIIYNSFSLLRIPLAFWVPDWTGTGVLGIAWVIATTCIVRTGLMLAWVSRGTWKTGLAREIAPESSSVPDACA